MRYLNAQFNFVFLSRTPCLFDQVLVTLTEHRGRSASALRSALADADVALARFMPSEL